MPVSLVQERGQCRRRNVSKDPAHLGASGVIGVHAPKPVVQGFKQERGYAVQTSSQDWG